MGVLGKFGAFVLGCLLVVLICAGGPAVWWYDRNFTGWSWGFHIPFTRCCSIGLPAGVGPHDAVKIATAERQRDQAVANERILTIALNDQSAAVRAWATAGASALAKSETATGAYRAALARASKGEAHLIALSRPTPSTPDACKRAEAVFDAFEPEGSQ